MTEIEDALAHISEKPWSAYTEADYSIEQWHNACLIHQHQGPPTSKAQCKLPVKTPNGALNRNGVHAAAAALAGARAELKASPAEKASAKAALLRLYSQLGDEPPDSLKHSDVDDVLEHHGIKGMKWGVRRSPDSATGLVSTRSGAVKVRGGSRADRKLIKNQIERHGSLDGKSIEDLQREKNLKARVSSADQINTARIQKKLNQGGVGALSNRELQEFSRRIQLEQEFGRASASQEALRGESAIRRFLKSQGKRQFNRVADKAVDLAVEKALDSAGIKIGKKNSGLGDALTEVSTRIKPKQKKKGQDNPS
jgi:hypothetical protein